jgi:hypothetical protein
MGLQCGLAGLAASLVPFGIAGIARIQFGQTELHAPASKLATAGVATRRKSSPCLQRDSPQVKSRRER